MGRSAGDAGKKGEGFGGSLKKAVGVAAAALAAAGIAQKLGEIVTAGSDLQQALGGAEAVFKKSFGGIDAAAQGAANALGLSRRQYLELATVLGAGLKNKGLKDYATQTQNLIKIGADLSAQYGGTTKDAVEALSSLLRGETDPIEKYGIAINQAAIDAEALRLGLVKNVKDGGKVRATITATAKAQAALSLVSQQSADAAGAFGRESDTLAGKQQRLQARIENVKERLGTALLPVLTNVSGWFLDKGVPAVEKFTGFLTDRLGPGLKGVYDLVFKGLWPALQDGAQTILPGVKKALSILTGGVGEGNVDWKAWGDTLTTKVIPFLAELINVYLPYVATQIRIVIEVVKAAWKVFIAWRDVMATVTAFILNRFAAVTRTGADMLDALSNVPGFGWAKDAADKLRNAANKAAVLGKAIGDIPKNVAVKVNLGLVTSGKVNLGNGVKVDVGLARARAGGGPVRRGMPYSVGDNPDGSWNKTTELFVPDQDGQILNQRQLAAAMGLGVMQSPGDEFGSESLVQRLVAALERAQLTATVSAGSLDAALGRLL